MVIFISLKSLILLLIIIIFQRIKEINKKIIPYSTHIKDIKDFRNKLLTMKKSDSKGKNIKQDKNTRINRNLNLIEYLSIGSPKIKKNGNFYLNNNNINKSPEIVIKRKYINFSEFKEKDNLINILVLN